MIKNIELTYRLSVLLLSQCLAAEIATALSIDFIVLSAAGGSAPADLPPKLGDGM